MTCTCPKCGAQHSRGPVNGTDGYRCLKCGNSWKGDPMIPAFKPASSPDRTTRIGPFIAEYHPSSGALMIYVSYEPTNGITIKPSEIDDFVKVANLVTGSELSARRGADLTEADWLALEKTINWDKAKVAAVKLTKMLSEVGFTPPESRNFKLRGMACFVEEIATELKLGARTTEPAKPEPRTLAEQTRRIDLKKHPPATPPFDVVERAIASARLSGCSKSKRGAVVYNREDRTVVGTGYNSIPTHGRDPQVLCDASEACKRDCAKRCVHAEARALHRLGDDLANVVFDLVHVKVGEEGLLVTSGGPSCWQCSKLVLDANIGGVWLYEKHDGVARWNYYPAKKFHEETLKACGIHPFSKEHSIVVRGNHVECGCGYLATNDDDLVLHIARERFPLSLSAGFLSSEHK